jgi:HK97 gp10 family phage protein
MSKSKSLTEQSKLLSARLNAIPKEVVTAVRPALVKGAEEYAATMRALAPRDEGDLIESIEVTAPGETTPAYAEGGGRRTAGPNQALVTVGNEDVRHGHLQEFGTVKQEAQPFMRL